MGEVKRVTKARMELEAMYSGIPDDSVNLTFQDFVQEVKHINTNNNTSQSTSSTTIDPHEIKKFNDSSNIDDDTKVVGSMSTLEPIEKFKKTPPGNYSPSPNKNINDHNDVMGNEGGGLRRPRMQGIPHSNICAICSTHVYLFKHRCLVCGRVYCKDCVGKGMGEMNEGRKCIPCLGRRFSARYIQRAAKTGCLTRYPSKVKQAELKWAEKGPRRSGERAYAGGSNGGRRANSPMRLPKSPINSCDPPSFFTGSPFNSPYLSPSTHGHFPI